MLANSVSATGAAAPLPFAGGVSMAYGGGISNGGPGVPPAALSVTDAIVSAKRLSGGPGIVLQGGGIFTDSGISATRTVVAGNCFGC